MEKYLGRKLLKEEIIHHINRDKLDNRIENLEIVNRSSHMKFLKGHCHFKSFFVFPVNFSGEISLCRNCSSVISFI